MSRAYRVERGARRVVDHQGRHRYVSLCQEHDSAAVIARHIGPDYLGVRMGQHWGRCAECEVEVEVARLEAVESSYGWSVADPAGGRWWPDAEAEAEIGAAADPGAHALRICAAEPMRGEWYS